MDEERRQAGMREGGDENESLNEAQLQALQTVERFGWRLRFVRKPLFLEPVPVVYSPEGKAFAVIEEDGKLNTEIDIRLRED